MKPRLLLLATAAALTCLAPAIHTPVRADARRPPSLTALVGRNALTRDTYGDGLPDSVAARVTVPSAPALADIEAATNLAARLGYDTTALSLPIVVRDNEVEQPSAVAAPILVGRENRFIKQLIDTRVIDIAVLKPGQGLIAAVASPLGGGDGLVVVGGDDEGTVNAGVELAARLPRVGGMTGIALPAIEEQAVRYLRSRGINVGDALITSLVVDSDKRGVARVALRIDVPGSPLGSWTFPKDTLYDVNDRSTWPTLYTNNLPTYANIPVKIYGTYLQDDWQAANGLTLNLGIRYDVQVGSFNEDVPGLLAKIQDKLGRDGTFPYDVSVIAQPTAGRGDHNNFGPRVGLAWDPANNGITNVHAAYGLFYDNVRTLTNFNELTWPQAKPITIQNPSYPDPFGGRTREAFLSATPPTITVGSNAQINPYAHQFNVGVNRLLRPDLAVTADFTTVSRYGDRDAPEINIPDLVTRQRPYPQFVRVNFWQPTADNYYKALLLKIEKRMSRHYQALLSYTLSKAEDDTLTSALSDHYGYTKVRRPGVADRRHSLVASGIVALPYDMQLSAIGDFRSSLPFGPITSGLDLNNDTLSGTSVSAPANSDLPAGVLPVSGCRALNLDAINAFRTSRSLTPVTQVDCPGFANVDLRFSKFFRIGGSRAELIAQLFNIFDRANFNVPGNNIGAGNDTTTGRPLFGTVTSLLPNINAPSRQAEFAVRFQF